MSQNADQIERWAEDMGRLRHALEFYADVNNWTQPTAWGSRILDDESRAIEDCGSIARAALDAFTASSAGPEKFVPVNDGGPTVLHASDEPSGLVSEGSVDDE